MLLSYAIVDMQISILMTRNQCRVSNTQVTIKAFGPLVRKKCVLRSSWGIDQWFYTKWDDAGVISNQHQNLCYTDMITSNSTLFDIQVPTNMGSVYIWMNTNMESKYFELDKNNYITSLSLFLSQYTVFSGILLKYFTMWGENIFWHVLSPTTIRSVKISSRQQYML